VLITIYKPAENTLSGWFFGLGLMILVQKLDEVIVVSNTKGNLLF